VDFSSLLTAALHSLGRGGVGGRRDRCSSTDHLSVLRLRPGVDHRCTTGHAVPACRLDTGVPLPHGMLHARGAVLPSFRVHAECSSTSEIVAFAVLLLPSSKSAHVPRRRLAGRPQVRHKGQEVEDEDERDGPLKRSSDRGDSVAGGGGMSPRRCGVASALRGQLDSYSVLEFGTHDCVSSSKTNGAGDGESDHDELENRVAEQTLSVRVVLVQ
jgi:hypothetical protein